MPLASLNDKIGSLTISINSADQSHVTDPGDEKISIPHVVRNEKHRFIPNPKDKPSKQRKLQRDFEDKNRWIRECKYADLSERSMMGQVAPYQIIRDRSNELEKNFHRTYMDPGISTFAYLILKV